MPPVGKLGALALLHRGNGAAGAAAACRRCQAKPTVRSGRIVAVNDPRLTAEQCQAIADRTMQSFDSLDAAEALARFANHRVDEVVTDELTGKSFRRII
jgi:hypothetical protein